MESIMDQSNCQGLTIEIYFVSLISKKSGKLEEVMMLSFSEGKNVAGKLLCLAPNFAAFHLKNSSLKVMAYADNRSFQGSVKRIIFSGSKEDVFFDIVAELRPIDVDKTEMHEVRLSIGLGEDVQVIQSGIAFKKIFLYSDDYVHEALKVFFLAGMTIDFDDEGVQRAGEIIEICLSELGGCIIPAVVVRFAEEEGKRFVFRMFAADSFMFLSDDQSR